MVMWGLAQKPVRAKLQTGVPIAQASAIPGPLPQENLPDIPELLLNEQGQVISLAAQEKAQQQKHMHGGFPLHQ